MADKLAKVLRSLPPKQLNLVLSVIDQILLNDLFGLDIKRLKGHKGMFRVRVGNYRVIFIVRDGEAPKIEAIAKRNERTYKNF